ncbi:DUF1453 family protein [Amycolatopsis acidiphila]|uniref:DUF1453 family protein n=1 Tax=Amycolatopsis acidiphila TaxID=715473 RepID=A0A557ZYN7_9PSEU|nr:DUF1453 family protein [Amycolatopsis acidiphila]TVT17120.1 DUF1453 family protein [Amycolatopsis acidiphila]UIJ58309.1 DUF1453 family protein [Amycolatopsis acidiphila]GHG95687.1 hypothetical protein GCM10017788_74380 [Amycolatopsis acidiphila]
MDPVEVLLYLVIAALVIWRVVFRQLRGSTITVRGLIIIPGILLVLGLENCARALPKATGGEIALLAVDLAVLLVLGVARAASAHLDVRDGYAFQKGTTLTLVLWLVTIAIRIGFGVAGARTGLAGPLTSSSVLLSMGLSIGVQNVLVYSRARRRELPIATSRSTVARG